MITKKLVALSALLVTSLLTSAIFQKKADAYQFRQISSNTDAGRHAQLEWVYNSDVLAHETGDVVVWKDGSVADGLEVSTTTTANHGLVAGVVVDRTIDAAGWGFIQTHGYCNSINVTGTVAAGDPLVTCTTGEVGATRTIAQSTGTAANEALIEGVYATALTSDSGGTVKGFIIR